MILFFLDEFKFRLLVFVLVFESGKNIGALSLNLGEIRFLSSLLSV
jgi:phage FluMu gp28-like protein